MWCVAATGARADPAGKATLTYFNRPVVTLRAPLLGMPPAERVTAAEARLHVALAETTGAEVSVTQTDLGRAVQVNGHLIFFLQVGDLDPEEGLTLQEAANRAADTLRTSLLQSLEQRTSESLTRSLLSLGVATAAFVLVVAALWWLRRKVLGLIERNLGQRTEPVRLGTLRLVHWNTIAAVLDWVLRAVTTGLVLGLGVQFVAFGLSQFPYTRPWGERLQDFIVSLLGDAVLGAVRVVPDLSVVAFIAWLTWGGMRLSTALFRQVEAGRWMTSWLTPETAAITRKLVSLALVLFAIVMAYPYLPGSDTEAFKGLSVLLGLMVSMGGSSTVGQAAAGLILIYTHAFSVGDQVRIGEVAGRVTAMGMFTTRIVTHLGEEIVLANAAVLTSTVRNFSREGQGLLLEVVMTIGYDVSWRQVESLMKEGAARTAALLAQPPPRVVVGSLDDFYVTYRLVAQTAHGVPRETVLAELQRHILDAFNEAQVQIMSPHYNNDPPGSPKLAPGSPEVEPRPA